MKVECMDCGTVHRDPGGDLSGHRCAKGCRGATLRRKKDPQDWPPYQYSTMLQVFLFMTFICAWALVKLVDAIVEALAR